VHATAFVTLIGWLLATGDWHRAITVAIAVLIITCPCALGLAVPIVQVVAARRLFENGIMVKDGSAIERMDDIDTAVFDKTGTLTLGRPRLANRDAIRAQDLALAARIAERSNHPFSRAIAAEGTSAGWDAPIVSDVVETPGLGVSARSGGSLYRLGRAEWALDAPVSSQEPGTVLSRDGQLVARFAFEDTLRPGARHAADALRATGLRLAILSGDTLDAVSVVARALDIDNCAAGLMPAEKVARLEAFEAGGHTTLMVGDGINDAPALAAAHVSMAPATAADIGRNTADFVFLREGLDAVPTALAVSREASRLVRQNFGLAVAYNAVALPVAIAGYVTPLIAALAMSFSSILVVCNALRLKSGQVERRPATGPAGRQTARKVVLEPRE
jgi:Cu2+-exporting ATPase